MTPWTNSSQVKIKRSICGLLDPRVWTTLGRKSSRLWKDSRQEDTFAVLFQMWFARCFCLFCWPWVGAICAVFTRCTAKIYSIKSQLEGEKMIKIRTWAFMSSQVWTESDAFTLVNECDSRQCSQTTMIAIFTQAHNWKWSSHEWLMKMSIRSYSFYQHFCDNVLAPHSKTKSLLLEKAYVTISSLKNVKTRFAFHFALSVFWGLLRCFWHSRWKEQHAVTQVIHLRGWQYLIMSVSHLNELPSPRVMSFVLHSTKGESINATKQFICLFQFAWVLLCMEIVWGRHQRIC